MSAHSNGATRDMGADCPLCGVSVGGPVEAHLMDCPEWDPHDIVPDAFEAEYDSLRDAKRTMERATDRDTCKRCPKCESTFLFPYTDKAKSSSEFAYRCDNCRHKFDDPKPPVAETAGRQATLEEVGGDE